jgi:AcrR family transcriptional regulator
MSYTVGYIMFKCTIEYANQTRWWQTRIMAKALTGRAAKAAQTRADLILAAQRVIGVKGYVAATVDDIAHEAGKTKGAFYGHFATKEELFLAMLNESNTAGAEEIANLPTSGDNPLQPESNITSIALSLEAYLYALRDPAVRPAIAPMAEQSLNALAMMAHNWRTGKAGGKPSHDDRVTALGLAATNVFGSILLQILPEEWNIQEMINEVDERIVQSVNKP